MTLELYKHQLEAIDGLKSGKKFMIAGCGVGKGACMLHWLKSTGKKKWLMVTTASKRDSHDFESECDEWFGPEFRTSLSSFLVLSWEGLRGSKRVPNWFNEHKDEINEWAIAFDESHRAAAGISSQVGTQFLKITNSTDCWTGYTATPAENWLGYYPYFTACGQVRNKTEFQRKFCIVQTFKGYPEIVGYRDTDQLEQWWDEDSYAPDTSELLKSLPPEVHKTVHFKKPTGYDKVDRTGYDLDGNFIETNSGMRHYLRQLAFTKDKLSWVKEFIEGLQESCVIFYTYNKEGDELEATIKKIKTVGSVWRICGKEHAIPNKETIGKKDVVLAQWVSGSNSINLQFINYWISTTPHDSYRVSCYDDQTEVLTPTGFRPFKDISVGDIVEAFDTTDNSIKQVPVLQTICRPIANDEKMYHYKSSFTGMDVAMTSSHDLVLSGRWQPYNWKKQELKKVLSRHSPYCVPVAGDYGTPDNTSVNDDELMLIGWFLADGCRHSKNGERITISQSEHNQKFIDEIKYLLDKLNIGYSITRSKKVGYKDVTNFVISPHTLQDMKRGIVYLLPWLDRSLPDELYSTLSKRQWLVLMEGYYHGNGCTKHITDYNVKTKRVCCGNRKELAEKMQHFLITHGIRANLHYEPPRVRSSWTNKEGAEQWLLSYKDSDYMTLQPHVGPIKEHRARIYKSPGDWVEINYNGNVYCLTNELGTTIVRRNGKVFIAGNCQARGRIQRIGADKDKTKFYYYLKCDGTEDDNIYDNLKAKGEWSTKAWVVKRKEEGKFLPEDKE